MLLFTSINVSAKTNALSVLIDLNQAIADALQANFSLVDYDESPKSNEKETDINKESYKDIDHESKKPEGGVIETPQAKENINVEKKTQELDRSIRVMCL